MPTLYPAQTRVCVALNGHRHPTYLFHYCHLLLKHSYPLPFGMSCKAEHTQKALSYRKSYPVFLLGWVSYYYITNSQQ